MAIPFTKYVDITSAVGGSTQIPSTELITRIFSINPLIPTGGVALEFSSLAAVGDYFGTSAEEYLRAVFYFGFISKSFSTPSKISYSFWASVATAPLIYGANLNTIGTTLAALQALTSGGFALTLGGVTEQITALDFAGLTFTEIATAIQTAVQAANVAAQWADATVTYSSEDGAFNFVGGETGAANVIVASPESGTDISSLIGWAPLSLVYPAGPIWSNGVAVETITDTLTNSAELSDNFGSFLFTTAADLDQSQVVEAATWNLAQNNEYMFLVPVTVANASAYAAALTGIGGTGLTLQVTAGEYAEMAPGMLMASTNYSQPNSVQNYMFQQFNLTPSVTDGTVAAAYDAIGVNYYGQTQTNGTLLSFYQNAYLTGFSVPTNALDMSVYANECWFKNAISAALGNLLLGVTQIPANMQGRSMVLNTIQTVITQALNNGTISVGALLTPAQIATITNVTADVNAWRQVQDIGYWIGAVISQNEDLDYIVTYTLVYKKNDVIRQITGTDILI